MLMLCNVPMFEGIRIHPGNSAADTEGCLLPGLSRAEDWVSSSRVAFNRLFDKLYAAEESDDKITIKIENSKEEK